MYYQLYWKDENERKKRPGIAQFKKLFFILYSSLACNVPTCLPTYLKHPSLMCTIVIDDCARHKCHHMWITLDTFSKWWMPKVFSTKDVIGEWTQPLTYLCSPFSNISFFKHLSFYKVTLKVHWLLFSLPLLNLVVCHCSGEGWEECSEY